MKKFVLIVLMALAAVFFVPTAAMADTGGLYHLSDSGYDPPFLVRCVNGVNKSVYEGQSSDTVCGGNDRTDMVYVRPNEKYRCERADFTWYTWLDANDQGWNNIGTVFRSCVLQTTTPV